MNLLFPFFLVTVGHLLHSFEPSFSGKTVIIVTSVILELRGRRRGKIHVKAVVTASCKYLQGLLSVIYTKKYFPLPHIFLPCLFSIYLWQADSDMALKSPTKPKVLTLLCNSCTLSVHGTCDSFLSSGIQQG